MAKEIFLVCRIKTHTPILAADSYELAQEKLLELATQFKREKTDYYIDELDLYTND